MNFATATKTAVYKDRHVVNVECDYLEEQGLAADQCALTRLQQFGASDPDSLESVRVLQEKLGIQAVKTVTVSPDTASTTRYRGRQRVMLSNPYGAYYTKLSLPHSAYHYQEVQKLWDDNPIETVELSMIPGDVKADSLRSDRLSRTGFVVLHFSGLGIARLMELLPYLQLQCGTLELRNVEGLSDRIIKALKQRLNWSNRNITIGKNAR